MERITKTKMKSRLVPAQPSTSTAADVVVAPQKPVKPTRLLIVCSRVNHIASLTQALLPTTLMVEYPYETSSLKTILGIVAHSPVCCFIHIYFEIRLQMHLAIIVLLALALFCIHRRTLFIWLLIVIRYVCNIGCSNKTFPRKCTKVCNLKNTHKFCHVGC
jgi:hypothetical protein